MKNKNKTTTGSITGINHDGSGVIEEKRPVHVYNTIPGEEAQVTYKKRIKKAVRADLNEILTPSEHRVKPLCLLAGKCGGCKWQHVSYEHQLELKKRLLTQTFQSAGLDFPLKQIIPAKEPFYYRNRMDFVFGEDGELGLREPGKWWSVLDVKSCFLQSETSNEILKRVSAWTKKTKLPFWNQHKHKGLFRYLLIREGKNTGERLVLLVTSDKFTTEEKEVIKSFANEIDSLATSIVWGINSTQKDDCIADEMVSLKGSPWLSEIVNGIRYHIEPFSFFQTNTDMAAVLQNTVKEACGDMSNKTLLDLYCGSGFFGLAFVKDAEKVIGIELDEDAIKAAKQNASENNLDIAFYASKIEDFDWQKENPDIVILDPPRSGLHPTVLETIENVKPKTIIYVSCGYRNYVKELPRFLAHYKITSMEAIDLFPHTPHIELVTKLELI